jgi:predicted RNase H-like HicB family nuclease
MFLTERKPLKLKVEIEWDAEAQAFSAVCPQLYGIASCGKTEEEALENLKDAISLYFETAGK